MTTEQSKPRGPYAKGVQRRQEILDRALEVFAEKGSEGTSLRAIGTALGVSHAALSHYFDSREALLLEVLTELDARAGEITSQEPSVIEGMAAGARRNVQIPGLVSLYTVLLASSVETGNDVSKAYFTERFANGRAGLAANLRTELAASDRVAEVDLDAVASLIMAAFDGLQIQWLLDRDIDIAGTLQLIERILEPRRPQG